MRVSTTGQIWLIRLCCTAPNNGVVDGQQAGEVPSKGGGRKSVTTHGAHWDTGVVMAQPCLLFDGLYVSEKVKSPYDIKMAPYQFGGALHNGALRLVWECCLGGVISIFSVLKMETLYCP